LALFPARVPLNLLSGTSGKLVQIGKWELLGIIMVITPKA
jgi:hypothetical protein